MKHSAVYEAPFGLLTITEENGAVTGLSFGAPKTDDRMGDSPILSEAKKQLDEYFAGERREFDLPLAYTGTAFQVAVWDALRKIPYGETRGYGDVALLAGYPKAARAVGNAVHVNPVALFVPCHRVILSDGRMGGFGGSPEVKRILLRLEGITPKD